MSLNGRWTDGRTTDARPTTVALLCKYSGAKGEVFVQMYIPRTKVIQMAQSKTFSTNGAFFNTVISELFSPWEVFTYAPVQAIRALHWMPTNRRRKQLQPQLGTSRKVVVVVVVEDVATTANTWR